MEAGASKFYFVIEVLGDTYQAELGKYVKWWKIQQDFLRSKLLADEANKKSMCKLETKKWHFKAVSMSNTGDISLINKIYLVLDIMNKTNDDLVLHENST